MNKPLSLGNLITPNNGQKEFMIKSVNVWNVPKDLSSNTSRELNIILDAFENELENNTHNLDQLDILDKEYDRILEALKQKECG